MRLTVRTVTMKIEGEKHRMYVRKSDLSGSTKARLDGAAIGGIAVTDVLAYWRCGRGANSA
jgi:hypothetical protein